MPLSDYERRVLDEIEQNWLTDDAVRALSTRRRGRLAALAVSLVLGIGGVVIGVTAAGGGGVAVAVIGFAVIVTGSWTTIRSGRRTRTASHPD